MKEYVVGDFIEGMSIDGKTVVGVIVKVNKTTYKLHTNYTIHKREARDVDLDYWDEEVKKRLITAMKFSIKGKALESVSFTNLKKAYIALFGTKNFNDLELTVKSHLGL